MNRQAATVICVISVSRPRNKNIWRLTVAKSTNRHKTKIVHETARLLSVEDIFSNEKKGRKFSFLAEKIFTDNRKFSWRISTWKSSMLAQHKHRYEQQSDETVHFLLHTARPLSNELRKLWCCSIPPLVDLLRFFPPFSWISVFHWIKHGSKSFVQAKQKPF